MANKIGTFIKRMFGKQSDEEQVVVADAKEQNDDDKVDNPFDFDKMEKKIFFRYEAAYRNQEIVLPRYNAENGIPVGDVIEKLFDGVTPHITGVTLIKTVQLSGVQTEWEAFEDIKEALKYDLFWNIRYKNKDGELYSATGTNITFVFRTDGNGVPPYIILYSRGTAIGYDETYIRITVMLPSKSEADDLRTSKSNSIPNMFSLLIVCDEKDNRLHFKEYEEAEKRIQHEIRDDIDFELYRGLREFNHPKEYLGYGKYLFEEDRYYDAYTQLSRAVNAMKTFTKVDMNDYYEACKYMAMSLQKMGLYEMADYYCDLAFCWSNDEEGQKEALKAEIRLLQLLKTRGTAFSSDLTIGKIMNRLLNMTEANTGEACVIDADGKVMVVSDIKIFWCQSCHQYFQPGTTIVLPYTRAYYQTNEEKDKSVLCSASSVIIRIDSANAEKNLMRTTVMIPNFNNDDDKYQLTSYNLPVSISFIISGEDKHNLVDSEDIDAIYQYAIENKEQDKFVEAEQAYLYVFNHLWPNYDNLSDEDKERFFRVAHDIGFCNEELQKHETALYYLNIASQRRIVTYLHEYINALVNNRDPRALKIIRDIRRLNFEAEHDSYEYKHHHAFLNRREAYVLIDLKRYDEAEAILQSLKDDEFFKDFAVNELKYIEHLRRQENS